MDCKNEAVYRNSLNIVQSLGASKNIFCFNPASYLNFIIIQIYNTYKPKFTAVLDLHKDIQLSISYSNYI